MLLSPAVLQGISEGRIDLIFRCWQKPAVRAGGTLLTFIGQLQFQSVEPTTLDAVSEEHAQRAGYPDRQALLDEFAQYTGGTVYRIKLGPVRPDPREALRATPLRDDEMPPLLKKLARLDAATPWTQPTLELIAARPGVRAATICRDLGQEREAFKQKVRKLKELGLTESLEVGYRLSPRGVSFLERLRPKPVKS